ncbi:MULTISPECIES: GNAT family N-acetyltransferase [Providencia]|uniref:GNAT family N-acetyltransferase n=1 Tax=Providencia manganoxydans TaxID=2923283 RepID=A0ABX7AB53_9GAMM|nr:MULTISPECIES: GNAT family N-acetyltransferase [Providencia]MDX4944295.1 GNAT family N-acetyltransferase [Providencia manganoxydans]QQO60749.1 GNAT family N-acetyltransferase [Providencia manganoxydans]HEF8772826.1 GNAT family N-acetyltransferase [Providencia stuartii]
MHFITLNEHHTHLIEQITHTLHTEWHELKSWSDLDNIRQRLITRITAPSPQTVACFIDDNEQLLATASIILNELIGIKDSKWWIGEIVTVPSARGKGIGSQLIEQLYHKFKQHTDECLYLYTPDMQALYRRMGWRDVQHTIANNEQVTVMKRG